MNKQSIITILLTVLMSMTGAKAFAHSIEAVNNDGVTIYYQWINNNTELAVSYRGSSYSSYNNEYTGNVVIPESVDYNGNTYPVTSIGSYAFYYCSDLTSVTIPNSITSIGSSAFSACTGLATIVSEIKTPFGIGSIVDTFYSTTLIVPIGSKAAYQSAGWNIKIVEVGEGGLVGSKFEIDGIYYRILENNTASITSANKSISGTLAIPSQMELNGKKYDVTAIDFEAFSRCNSLTSVSIPGSVTSIDEWAFSYNTGITSVTISHGVTSIGSYAFQGCSSLTSVTIPSSVTSINDQTFLWCSGLTSVTIPSSVTSIGKSAFSGCSGLTSVIIPDYVTSIGISAFANCRGLTSVTIPNSVTSIGSSAFSGCKGLTSVTIPDKVTSINDHTFNNCSGLTSVAIPNSVSSIGESAFQGCSGLTSVTIPNSVTSIGESAFKECNDLYNIISEIEVPFEIGYIADYSATLIVPVGTKATYQSTAGWSSFTKTVEAGEGGLVGDIFGIDGIYYTIGENNTVSLTSANKSISGALAIPSQLEYNGKKYNVTSIGNKAFYNFYGLTSVTIPNSVTSIGSEAFYGCSSMTSVTISNSVTSIDYWAFKYCNSLNSVKVPVTDFSAFCNNKVINIIRSAIGKTIHLIDNEGTEITEYIVPNDVTSIGAYAFSSCSSLTSVTIPNSVTSIGESAFYNCSGLTSVTVPVTDFSAFCNNKVINLIRSAIGKTIHLIDIEGTEITQYIVPNDVTSIGEFAFYNCRDLSSVTIGNSVTSISNNAFANCSGLTSVIIGSGVLSIGSSAFPGTTLKKTIWLTNTPPSGYNNAKGTVNYVSNDQFNIDNKVVYKYLSSNFVVDGIRYVPVSPSDHTCDAIDCIYDESAENINISETVTNKKVTLTVMKVNPYTCYQNKHIKEVKLSLGGDIGDYAFYGCEGLNTATVSNKGSIGASAFQSCSALETANISNIGDIGAYAFQSCSALETANISNIGDIGANAFSSCSALTTATISNQGDIGAYAFGSCSALTTATINNQGAIGNYAFNSCSALTTATINNQGGIGNYSFSGCSLLETAELGQNVTSIGGNTFSECSKLKSIVIPDAVTSLGSYAFKDCAAMTSVKIGNGTETIDQYTFSGCSSLAEINIGSKVKTINQYAFSGCSTLPAITIPQAVTTIGDNVFYNCTSLAKVTIADSENTLTLGTNGSSPIFSSCPLDYVYIGRDISYQTSSNYGYSPFYRNTKLREVKITDKETEISDNEFYGCTNLQTVTIGDGVTTIGKWAFSGCSSLEYFTFGSKLEEIGQEAFSDCTALVQITSKSKKAPACGSQALEDINKWECKLNVPKGYLAVYQEADQWKDFWFMEEGEYIPPMKGDVNSDGKVDQDDLRDLVEYIMGGNPNGVTDESANVNGDNKVDVADVVALTSLLE